MTRGQFKINFCFFLFQKSTKGVISFIVVKGINEEALQKRNIGKHCKRLSCLDTKLNMRIETFLSDKVIVVDLNTQSVILQQQCAAFYAEGESGATIIAFFGLPYRSAYLSGRVLRCAL